MGQFVAACARDSSLASRLLSSCTSAATALIGSEPAATRLFGRIGITGFGRHRAGDESGQLHEFSDPPAWCLGAGSWVDRASDRPISVTRRIAAAHGDTSKLARTLSKIDGTYSFVTGADGDDSVRIITDPLGQLHVYTIYLPDAVLVSTSAILLAHVGGRSWEPLAVREFLARGTVYADRSLFEGVRKVAPATILTFSRGEQTDTHTYWAIRDHIINTGSAANSLDRFATSVQSATADIYQQFRKPALDLTGGFDSRILLAAVRKDWQVSSIDTVVVGSAQDADTIAAGRIAKECNLRHRRIDNANETAQAWWQSAKSSLALVDGEYDVLEYAGIKKVHRMLAEQFGASINGSGGELIRGYWWELLFPRIGALDSFSTERVARQRFATDTWAEQLLAEDFGDTLSTHFGKVIQNAVAELQGLPNTASMDSVYLKLRMQRWQGRIASATNRIWPSVSPLLFRDCMEAALSAPVALRRNGRMARQLLTQMDRSLAELPLAGGYPALPMTLSNIHRFMPLAREWGGRIQRRLGHSLPLSSAATRPTPGDNRLAALLNVEEVGDLLNPAGMRTAELYRAPQLREFSNTISAQQRGHVGRMLTLELIARSRQRLPHGQLKQCDDL